MNPPGLKTTRGVGGVVLCGGQSSRMGRPKASLPFGDELLLQRVVRRLGEAVSPLVVVAAVEQALPELPPEVRVVRDQRPSLGPLEGLYAGLLAVRDDVKAAFVVGCDAPLLKPEFVRHLCSLLQNADIVVPHEGKHFHPLSAVYRVGVVRHIEQLREEDRMRPAFLFDLAPTLRVPVEQLRLVDPQLESLLNLNYPEDYQTALKLAGLLPGE